jgi:hypothetical protein
MTLKFYDAYISVAPSTPQQAYKDDLQAIMNDQFENSSTYELITLNDSLTEIPARIFDFKRIEDYNVKTIVLKPGNNLSIGDIINSGNIKYLCLDADFANGIYYKGKIKSCNQSITLTIGGTKVTVGYDDFGRSVKRPINTDTYTWHCIVQTKIVDANSDKPINPPIGKIFIMLPYSLPYGNTISENMEFDMWSERYKITGFDKTKILNNFGVLGVWAERVVK